MIILIVLVVAMVVGPVAMMQPNSGQRRREHLRQYARESGLTVRLLPPPQQATDSAAPSAMPVYSLVTGTTQPSWSLMRTSYEHESHVQGWWQFLGSKPTDLHRTNIEAVLEELPDGVVGLRSGARQVDIFWRENGEEQAIDQLLSCLKKLSV
ncbi:hypothetical protein [Gilvimarinus agarilyticus]|uniref:hypothetical protein n=1 Tax=Gilvimarinus agarilyticus TaxID=679259 RepID=UPI0012FB1547|nr:hypothetical protein [Gilvimarinus agarilyticus]